MIDFCHSLDLPIAKLHGGALKRPELENRKGSIALWTGQILEKHQNERLGRSNTQDHYNTQVAIFAMCKAWPRAIFGEGFCCCYLFNLCLCISLLCFFAVFSFFLPSLCVFRLRFFYIFFRRKMKERKWRKEDIDVRKEGRDGMKGRKKKTKETKKAKKQRRQKKNKNIIIF